MKGSEGKQRRGDMKVTFGICGRTHLEQSGRGALEGAMASAARPVMRRTRVQDLTNARYLYGAVRRPALPSADAIGMPTSLESLPRASVGARISSRAVEVRSKAPWPLQLAPTCEARVCQTSQTPPSYGAVRKAGSAMG